MRIRINFFALMLILSLLISGAFYGIIPLIAALLHEAGHIIAARLRGVRLGKMEIGVFGARISIENGIYSYSDEIIVCAAGPLVNFISADIAAIVFKLGEFENDLIPLFIFSSLCLGTVNLLPIRSFDGGRIICALISRVSTPDTADITVKILSFISLFSLWCVSLYLLLRTSASLSLFIFSVSLFANIFIDTQGKKENQSFSEG